jgi:UDP-N-acetylglucosamine 2-epimerase (non-hydrolysing)
MDVNKNIKKIILLVGARPNFMKMIPVYKSLKELNKYQVTIIHTEQHYDFNMSTLFFQQFNLLSSADLIILNSHLKDLSQNKQISQLLSQLEDLFLKLHPDLVIVFGDVTSTLAGALAANKMNIPVAHVESGNRSFDKTMPEEINRILVDHLSKYHFISEPNGIRHLIDENLIQNEKTWFYVGNPMIDTLLQFKQKALDLKYYLKFDTEPYQYLLMTLHRPSNVDNPFHLNIIIGAIIELSKKYKIIFPVHPRSQQKIQNIIKIHKNVNHIILTEPLGYLEFISLMMYSGMILTDSGGNSEEATILEIPCVTLRSNTERQITCTHGTNHLIKSINKNEIIKKVNKYFGIKKEGIRIFLWDGKAGERIALHVNLILSSSNYNLI